MKYKDLLLQLVRPQESAEIVNMLSDGTINRNQAREVFDELFEERKAILDRLLMKEEECNGNSV